MDGWLVGWGWSYLRADLVAYLVVFKSRTQGDSCPYCHPLQYDFGVSLEEDKRGGGWCQA